MRLSTSTALFCLSLMTLASCKSAGPTRIDASGDEAVTSMDLDYAEFVEIAGDMAGRLVSQQNFLSFDPYAGKQVKMVLSDVENRTDIRDLQTNQITSRVRSVATNSGRIRFVSSFGGGETDSVVQGSQGAANDPRFNQENVPEAGSLTYPQLALKTIIDQISTTDGQARQVTYSVHMFVSEIKTGEIVWEEFSDPIAKKAEKGGFGF